MKTLAIVGYSPTTRNQAPFDNQDITIAGLNEEHVFDWFARKTGNLTWFQLHPRESFTRESNSGDPKHWEWLQKKHPFPIYMQQKWDDIPSGKKYPLEKVYARFGNYFTNTLTFIMAWAVLEEYERLELYGFDMASDTEYKHQRPNACYWIGMCRGMGIDVYIPPESKLLRGYARYAYDDVMLGARQEMEIQIFAANDRLKSKAEAVNHQRGRADAYRDVAMMYPELVSLLEKEERKATEMRDEFYMRKGWVRGMTEGEKLVDKYIGLTRNTETEKAPV